MFWAIGEDIDKRKKEGIKTIKRGCASNKILPAYPGRSWEIFSASVSEQ